MDEKIVGIIKERVKNNELPCAVAFDIAAQSGVFPAVIGEYANQLTLHLIKCQLGLFGYRPEKIIVKPASRVDPELEAAIKKAMINERLPCESAWKIAEIFQISKMTVSGACETLGIKIKPCQLGAF